MTARRGKFGALLLAFSLCSGLIPTATLLAQPSTAPIAAAPMDVACDTFRALAVNDTLTQPAMQQAADAEWIKVSLQKSTRYHLEVTHAEGLQLALYDQCSTRGPAVALHDGLLDFSATRDGDYYLLATPDGAAHASAGGYRVTLTLNPPYRRSFSALADVPEAVLRRAVDFLEEMRGSDLAPEWKDARVNPQARILYRPDMQEPAYYEFTVEKPVDGRFQPAGFIQLAAGTHDFPVTHWNTSGMSPTQDLAEIAPLNAKLTEFYKVDSLSYAAEYEEVTPIGITAVATDVINLGDLPGRINGLEGIPETAAELVTESIDSNNNKQHEGPTELPLTSQEDWPSWAALKAQYKEEYDPLLKSLKQRADGAWTLEDNLSKHGESLVKGDVRTVHGLAAQTLTAISVSGEGAAAQYLQQEQLNTQGQLSGIRLTVLDEPKDQQTRLTFDVALTYSSGNTETLKYAIISSAVLSTRKVLLPLILRTGSGPQLTHAAPQSPQLAGDWGPWHYWWVDADGDANGLRYGQFTVGGCASGCGATAWAMLFGWTDRRAEAGHALWGPHWGLYRPNGGLVGNTTAPLVQDAGVENMTREIRNHIGTFCIFGSGATWPWRMIDASNYVRPRATAPWRMSTRYDPTGLCWFGACNGSRDLARDQIVNRRAPAIVGTGWLKHYPMAFGYAERSKRTCFLWICSTTYSRWFYVNNGWYGRDNGWTSADVWFGGAYYDNR